MKPGPNDPCPCGSGKKHKKCCGSISAPRTLKPLASALDVPAALELATQYHQAGRLEHAEAVYRQILAVQPNDPNALHLLGLAAHQSGKHAVAADLIRRALNVAPRSPIFLCNLGVVLSAQGNREEAITCYERALALQPDYAEAHNNLGVAKMQQGNPAEAIVCYQRALAVRPNYADAHYHLGLALRKLGRAVEAIGCFERALELRADYADAHSDLGAALQGQGELDKAIAHYEQALRLRPNAETHNNLGIALEGQGRLDEAATHYERASQLAPGYADPCFNLAGIRLDQCRLGEAIACFERAQHLRPNDRNKIALASARIPIVESSAALLASRQQFLQRIGELLHEDLALTDPLSEGLTPNFLLAYHGLDDRELQEATAQLYLQACPALSWVAPHCRDGRERSSSARIKIGFVSRYFYNHTVGEVMHGLVGRMNRDRFEVTVFKFPGQQDHISRRIDDAADHVLRVPYSLSDARNQISSRSLDILVFPEIGMDPATYFLAFSRLAPVQCATWGHPDTSGIPNIDYYVSGMDVEPPDAQRYYSERLIALQHLPTYYYPPPPVRNSPDREALGLPRNAKLYVCPQTLYKFHPDFDDILGAILRRDPRALLVLFHGKHPAWATCLRQRFAESFPDGVDRVVFLRRLPMEHYLWLLREADAVLDTLHFGGGNTTYQAFGVGAPVVTWPGSFARGRVTYALYKRMEVMNVVTDSAEHYVEMALKLANDRDFHEEMAAAIRKESGVIFEDVETVRELELFFENALKAARRGTFIEGKSVETG